MQYLQKNCSQEELHRETQKEEFVKRYGEEMEIK